MDQTRKYLTEFKKKTYKGYSVQFNKLTEKKYIDILDSITEKKDFIKRLIDESLKKEGK